MTASPAPPVTPRARDAGATRQDLLHAAMRRFTVLGYDRTTSRDVAADAGVNVSLVNRYFGSKDGLFTAVMRESVQSMSKVTAIGPDDLVAAMIERMDPDSWPEYGHEHPLLLLLQTGGSDDRVGPLRRRSLAEIVDQLTTLVDGGSAPDDAALRAELVLALVAGVLTLRAARPDGALAAADIDPLRAALTRTTAAILHGG